MCAVRGLPCRPSLLQTCIDVAMLLALVLHCSGGKAPAGASRLALTLNGSETEEQLAQINSVDAVVALLDIQLGVQDRWWWRWWVFSCVCTENMRYRAKGA